ncbi:MAG: glycosyltransferase family 4 protein [Chloroflexi bacterium]|nr:MAG: glycosyltransferase family 4 protein [Chloroflexota bacterium]
MRIGMVTACYKPVINGVTRMVSLYKQYLEALGHEVYVFTLGEPDPAGDEDRVVRSSAMPLGESGYYVSVGYSSEARALIQEMDIIHCHHLFMSVELAHRYARCPIVYTNHTRYDLYSGTYSPLPQPAADVLMRRIWPEFTDFADVVITPSESVKQVMLDFGVRRPIEVIENGVDLRPFQSPPTPLTKTELGIPEESVLLTYVGRLSMEKNLPRLLEQFAIAQDIVPHLHLLLIGGGPIKDDLPHLAQKLKIENHVHFTGPLGYEVVANYLAAADIFVTASESEVHPLTVIEAMAAGLPIVAPSSPGIVDTVLSGASGLLTKHVKGGLAASIVGLAMNPNLREAMVENASEASLRYDIEGTVTQTVALYEKLCEERPDLKREREHGRWVIKESSQPLLAQLQKLLRPPERDGTDRPRWWEDWFERERPKERERREP